MKRRTLIATATTLLVVAFTAMAYFFVAGLGEGEGSAKLGKGSPANYPVKVQFADGLTPGQMEPLHLTLEPTAATDVKSITVTPSTGVAGCGASNFKVTSKNGFWKSVLEGTQSTTTAIPAGATDLESFAAALEVGMIETGADQTACESATLTLHVTVTP